MNDVQLTSEEREQILETAREYGEIGQYGHGSTFSADDLYDVIERVVDVDLGSNTDAPIFAAIRKEYNAAWREANV